MKATLSFLTAIATLMLLLFISSSYAQDPLPYFNVHVVHTSCNVNVSGASVKIKYFYQGQSHEFTQTTNEQGWAYFTAPYGTVHVKVTLSWDPCTGYEDDIDHVEPNHNYEVCLYSWCE